MGDTYQFCECDFDSQVAYVANKITDKTPEPITILEYLKNKTLIQKIKSNRSCTKKYAIALKIIMKKRYK